MSLHRAVGIPENVCGKMSRPINLSIPPDGPRATPSTYCFQILADEDFNSIFGYILSFYVLFVLRIIWD